MSSHNAEAHQAVGPELRNLLRTILASLDPVVRAATERTARTGGTPRGECQQTWCALCALASLKAGEQHPLSTLVAEHGASLLALLRTLVEAKADSAGEEEEPPASRYQPIPVTVVL